MSAPAYQVKDEFLKQRELITKSSGLSERVLPPLTSRQVAIYRSFEDDQVDPLILEARFNKVLPPHTIIEGTYAFNDPFEPNLYQRSKLMKNISRLDRRPEVVNGRATGKEVFEEQIDPVIFEAGWKRVNIITEYPLYVFLELHPLNKNNRYRNALTNAFFREDITYRGNSTVALEQDLALEAEIKVRDMDSKDVMQYASAVPNGAINVVNRSIGDIRRDLRFYVRQHPRVFFDLIRNSASITQFIVAQSRDHGFVVYDKDLKTWFHYGEPTPLLQCEKTEKNPAEVLIKFLGSKEGGADLKILEEKVNYWAA